MRFSTRDKECPPLVKRATNLISSITSLEYPEYSSSITLAFAEKKTDNLSSISLSRFNFSTVIYDYFI